VDSKFLLCPEIDTVQFHIDSSVFSWNNCASLLSLCVHVSYLTHSLNSDQSLAISHLVYEFDGF
jgi:hypothetical protein